MKPNLPACLDGLAIVAQLGQDLICQWRILFECLFDCGNIKILHFWIILGNNVAHGQLLSSYVLICHNQHEGAVVIEAIIMPSAAMADPLQKARFFAPELSI